MLHGRKRVLRSTATQVQALNGPPTIIIELRSMRRSGHLTHTSTLRSGWELRRLHGKVRRRRRRGTYAVLRTGVTRCHTGRADASRPRSPLSGRTCGPMRSTPMAGPVTAPDWPRPARSWRRCGSRTTPDYLRQVMARAGEAPEVVLEATYGWYWAAGHARRAGRERAPGAPAGV